MISLLRTLIEISFELIRFGQEVESDYFLIHLKIQFRAPNPDVSAGDDRTQALAVATREMAKFADLFAKLKSTFVTLQSFVC